MDYINLIGIQEIEASTGKIFKFSFEWNYCLILLDNHIEPNKQNISFYKEAEDKELALHILKSIKEIKTEEEESAERTS